MAVARQMKLISAILPRALERKEQPRKTLTSLTRLGRNTALPEDVDDNGTVTEADVVAIILHLDQEGKLGGIAGQPLQPIETNAPPPFLDTNGDGELSIRDAVLVNRVLNRMAD